MQITLVQTELEQAIREYVGRQLTVAEGTKMNIELTATRGAEGFKATIDILPAESSISVVQQTPKAVQPLQSIQPSTAPFPIRQQPFVPAAPPAPVEEVISSTAETAETGAEASAAPFEGGTVSDETQSIAGNVSASDTDTGASEGTDGAVQGEAPRKSLFGSMKRPKNT